MRAFVLPSMHFELGASRLEIFHFFRLHNDVLASSVPHLDSRLITRTRVSYIDIKIYRQQKRTVVRCAENHFEEFNLLNSNRSIFVKFHLCKFKLAKQSVSVILNKATLLHTYHQVQEEQHNLVPTRSI